MKLLILVALAFSLCTACLQAGSIQVPSQVKQQIKVAAAEKWNGDYEMQAYMIKNQSEAYQKLMQWGNANKTSDVAKSIFRAAQKKWKGDYEMQWYMVENQVEAYNQINN
jgi:hypothetical protein